MGSPLALTLLLALPVEPVTHGPRLDKDKLAGERAMPLQSRAERLVAGGSHRRAQCFVSPIGRAGVFGTVSAACRGARGVFGPPLGAAGRRVQHAMSLLVALPS